MVSPMSMAEAVAALAGLEATPKLIAVDGLPLSGKSGLASRLAHRFDWAVLGFDDFFLPPERWPPDIAPAFPFPFFRVDEFRSAVRSLREHGVCCWRPIDWSSLTVQAEPTGIDSGRPVIVEGCSVLDPELSDLYDVRLFVESDRNTLAQAQKARDGENALSDKWATLFLPSVEFYMWTRPEQRADLIVAGRDWGRAAY
jgi:uridine kinase